MERTYFVNIDARVAPKAIKVAPDKPRHAFLAAAMSHQYSEGFTYAGAAAVVVEVDENGNILGIVSS